MATRFHEQVSVVLELFLAWNECEQMVVLCSLLRRISSAQARFIAQVFDQMFKNCADPATEQLELQANDPAFVNGLAKESKSTIMSHLLKCLPLVKVGNTKVRAEYIRIIPVVMAHSLKHRTDLEDCRHLLSYLIIHPAFSREELPLLSTWQSSLNELHQVSTATASSGVPSASILAQSEPTSTRSNTGWNGVPDIDLANYTLCGKQLGEGQVLGISRSSANRLTIASSSGDSGFSDLEKCSSVGGFPLGRPLRSSTSMPLVEASQSGFLRANANASVHAVATPHREQQLKSIFSQEKCTTQSDDRSLKLSRPPPVSSSKSVPSNVAEWLNRQFQPTVVNKLHPNLNSDSLHTPLSPQSSVTSSGSGRSVGGEALDERRLSQGEDIGNMRDMSLWLKSLRLHKYANLFQNMTYEEMLNLNDEWLEKQNVTKGARNKIILSIQKLRSRQEALQQMEKNLLTPGTLRETIGELMQMLKMPMKHCDSSAGSSSKIASSDHDGSCTGINNIDDSNATVETESVADGDLPGHLTRLFGKICSRLLVDPRLDGECLSGYLQLLDRALSLQVFTKEQKRKMTSWKQQIYRTFQLHAIQKQNLDRHHVSLENVVQGQGAGHAERRVLRGQQFLSNPVQPTWSFGLDSSSVLTPTSQPPDHPSMVSQSQCQNDSVTDLVSGSEGKQPLGRTKSAPIRSQQMGLAYLVNPGISQDGLTTDDINASLDSLCISMTEHALEGGFGEVL